MSETNNVQFERTSNNLINENIETKINKKPESFISKWTVLIILILAQTIVVFDNGTLMIAADSLTDTLSMSLSELQQANTIYPMVGAIFMIAGGMLGMIIGWRLQLQLGIALLVFSSIAAALAPNASVFIFGARVLAGLGGGMMVPAIFGYCTAHYKGKDQALAFGFLAGSVGLTGMLAPLFLGYIIDSFSYRASYYLVAIYCLLVLIFSFTLTNKKTNNTNLKFDFGGMLLIGTGLLLIIVSALYISKWGLISPLTQFSIGGYAPTIPIFLLGALFVVLFIKWEERMEQHERDVIFPRALRHNKQVLIGMFYCAMTYLLYPTMIFITITYLQLTGIFTATESGLIIGLNAFGMVTTSILTPSKLSHFSSRKLILLASSFCAVGVTLMWLAYNNQETSFLIYVAQFVFGLGCGIYASHAPYIITSSVSQKNAEQSSGLQTTSRNFGKALGVAILGTILAVSYSNSFKSYAEQSHELSSDTHSLIRSQMVIPFSSDIELANMMTSAQISKNEQTVILDLVEVSRLEGLRCAFGGFFLLLLISVTVSRGLRKNIPDSNKS
ncbi:MFS transporter [Vibrio lamellibrachiae]|uniref:MFS transporter n=1 Tax=Vibrio lamellibrachiae TaxID=2910253 RepID=UPI003D108EA9